MIRLGKFQRFVFSLMGVLVCADNAGTGGWGGKHADVMLEGSLTTCVDNYDSGIEEVWQNIMTR